MSRRTVFVIEDHDPTSEMLTRFLKTEFTSLFVDPDTTASTWKNVRPASHEEPGVGQLAHLAPLIEHFDNDDGATPPPVPNVSRLTKNQLAGLIRLAAAFTPSFGHSVETGAAVKRLASYVNDIVGEPPLVLAVDLAMSTAEGEFIAAKGGVLKLDDYDFDKPGEKYPDCREDLRRLTGFKVMRAFRTLCPVVVSSSCNNPLVAQHCLVNGATAFVTKPVTQDQMERIENHEAFALSLGHRARENEDVLHVAVNHYLMRMALEVAKAMAIAEHFPYPSSD